MKLPLHLLLSRLWAIGFGAALCLFVSADVGAFSHPELGALAVLCLICGAGLLALTGIRQRMIQVMPFFLLLLFGLYSACIAWLTSEQSGFSLLVSRNAFVLWFLAGVGSAVALYSVKTSTAQSPKNGPFWFLSPMLICMILLMGFAPSDDFYQSMSNWILIALITAVTTLAAASAKPALIISTGIIGIMLLLLSGMRGSNVSIAFALVLTVCCSAAWILNLKGPARTRGLIACAVLVVLLALFLQYLVISGLVRMELTSTGGLQISSLSSRINLWKTFPAQFFVSPISGNFSAELIAGPGKGYYQHSVPLSLLSHTGLLGTGIFSASLVLLGARLINRREVVVSVLLLTVLIVGSIATFFSWLPLWYVLGIACVQPAYTLKTVQTMQ